MPTSCCVVGCTSRGSSERKLAFHRIPKNRDRREKWVTAINRDDWTPSDSSRVCGRHFVTGRKNEDPIHVDFTPSVAMEYNSTRNDKTNSDARFQRQRQRLEKAAEKENQCLQAANMLLELANTSTIESESPVSNPDYDIHDNCLKTITDLKSKNLQLLKELERLQSERDKLKLENEGLRFGAHFVNDSDNRTSANYTGPSLTNVLN